MPARRTLEDGSQSEVVFAYRFDAAGQATRRQAGGPVGDPDAAFLWLHLNLADRRARDVIAGLDMPADARAMLLEPEERSRFEIEEGWLFGQLADLGRDIDAASDEIVYVRFAVGPNGVFTARRHPAQALDRLRRDLDRGRLARDPRDFLEAVVDRIAAGVEKRRQAQDETLTAIEARLLADRHADVAAALGDARRVNVEITRHLGAVTSALRRFEQIVAVVDAQNRELRDWATGLAHRFDEVMHDARADAERARLLQDEANASGNWLANRQLFVLTVLNSLLLPATLVTGFFGMNTGGPLWGADDLNGTLKALVLCCMAAAGAALFMRRRGMFR
ncbi:MAG: hypothetical protein JNK46_01700 [Methylobacteriaceae bacterium]|nr:hypothetical protein [Methylobacteriaceae bacterium]